MLLFSTTKSVKLPKSRTNKYYKYYKNSKPTLDMFYNNELAVLYNKTNSIFAYENMIIVLKQDYLTNRVIKDFVIVHHIKPHNIEKIQDIQQRIDVVVKNIKVLIEERKREGEDFVYTHKPFTVCFVEHDSYEPSVTHYEISAETLDWVPVRKNYLEPCCDDFSEIQSSEVILNRYYALHGYAQVRDTDSDDEYKEKTYGLSIIYDLLTGKIAYEANTPKYENYEYQPRVINLDKTATMLIGKNLYIIPVPRVYNTISELSIYNTVINFDKQSTKNPDEEDIINFPVINREHLYNEGIIQYVFRNLKADQIIFVLERYIQIWKIEAIPLAGHLIKKEREIKIGSVNSDLKHILLHEENFFVILFADKINERLYALCIYYNTDNDLYNYHFLDITDKIQNKKIWRTSVLSNNQVKINNAEVISKIVVKKGKNDCLGLVIKINAKQAIVLFYNKRKEKFYIDALHSYTKIVELLSSKRIRTIARSIASGKISDSVEVENIHYNNYELRTTSKQFIVCNSKSKNKIHFFHQTNTVYVIPKRFLDLINRTRVSISPNELCTLESAIEECYFECEEPTLIQLGLLKS